MSIMELGALGEFVGSLVVVVTLIYLARQIRQNTDVTRSAAASELSSSQVAFFMQVAASPDLAKVVKIARQDPGALSEIEIVQYEFHTGAVFSLMEGAYKQFQLGFLRETGWKPYERVIKDFLSNPISHNWWVNSPVVFSPEFEAAAVAVSGVERKTT